MRRKGEKHPLRFVVLISQLGITMMVALFFCGWIGNLISQKTGNLMWFVLFLILGILAGFRSCYDIICRFVDLRSSTDVKEQKDRKNHDIDQMDKQGQRDTP